MSDIAERVGISRVAVSYALNGQPGVSSAIRAEVLRVAAELGFAVNRAALAMRGASSGAVGLVLRRSSPGLAGEAFHRQLISGIELELSARGFGLALQFVDDVAEEGDIYRRWLAERRVDGIVVCDLLAEDPRPAELVQLGLPAVVLGGEAPGLSSLRTDEAAAAAKLVGHLAALGHRRIARMAGLAELAQTRLRTAAVAGACRDSGIEARTVLDVLDASAAAAATRQLVGGADPPTAVVYDNDLTAVGGLGAAAQAGWDVPGALSIAAWADSPVCAALRPSITVLRRNVAQDGSRAVRLLFEQLDGRIARSVQQDSAELVVRDSTGLVTTTSAPAAGG